MQESTYSNPSPPTPPSAHWPGDEELAAYIDGKLGKAESRRIERHLATCEDCYAVFAGTVQFQLETEPVPASERAANNVVRFPSPEQARTLWRVAVTAAATVLLGAGGGGWFYFVGPLPRLVTAQVTEPVPFAPGSTGGLWLGPTSRGGGDDGEGAPIDPASFQAGVQLVNLQVCLNAGRGEDAQDIVARILILLKDQMFVQELTQGYTGLTVAIEKGTPPKTLAGKASELATEAREVFDPPHLDLGQWIEAGRLAAIAEEPSFFRQGRNRAFLRRLLWRQKLELGEMEIDPAALQSLRAIADVLGKGSLGPSDYAGLRRSFEAILNVYYPQS